jgi:hypothetical protein
VVTSNTGYAEQAIGVLPATGRVALVWDADEISGLVQAVDGLFVWFQGQMTNFQAAMSS